MCAELLQVRLRVLDLLPRPRSGLADGEVGDLKATEQRIEHLAVELTAQRVEKILHWVNTATQEQAQQSLEAAMQGTQSSLALEHRGTAQ